MNTPFDCISDFIFIDDPPEKADVILVPGESHTQLMARAADLYRQGFAPYLLPSGGYNPKIPEYESEWEFLRGIALQRSVPEAAILKENRARNTFENAEFSHKVLLEKEIHVHKALIVCKAFHARRALLTYQAVFSLATTFLVSSVTDYRGITKENWFTREDYIAVVMGEVRKIGQYFEVVIPKWVSRPDIEIKPENLS